MIIDWVFGSHLVTHKLDYRHNLCQIADIFQIDTMMTTSKNN